MAENKRIGYIGLGQMGGGMADNLLKAGYSLVGYDTKPETANRFDGKDFVMATSAAEVVAVCNQVHTCLWGDVFYQIADNELVPWAKEGQLFVDHSTLSASKIRKYASKFAEKGAVLLDAPVSGGTGGSNSGMLTVFVGGDDDAFAEIKDSLLAIADPKKLIYGGESGKGQVLKIIQQLKERILTLGRLEVLAFGVNENVPMETILQVLGETPGSEGEYAATVRNIAERNEFALSCMYAEWKYYLDEAEDADIPLPIITAANEFYKDGAHTTKDNVGRPGPWLWHELTGQD